MKQIITESPPCWNEQDQGRPQLEQEQPKSIKTGTWSPSEDSRLREAVAKYGTRWVAVAVDVETRNGDQCAKRWKEKLNPELDHSPWTSKEEEHLLCLVDIYGHNWKFIAESFFEARAPLALKNRYSLLMRRMKRQQQQTDNNSIASISARQERSCPPSSNYFPRQSVSNINAFPAIRSESHNQYMQTNGLPLAVGTGHVSIPSDPITSLFANAEEFSISGYQSDWSSGDGERSRNAPITTPTSTIIEHDVHWQQKHGPPLLEDETKLCDYDSASRKESTECVGDQIAGASGLSTGSLTFGQQGNSFNAHSTITMEGHDGSSNRIPMVEYSITCRQSKLKNVVNHLMDAAVTESAAWTAENEPVTLRLQLKGSCAGYLAQTPR